MPSHGLSLLFLGPSDSALLPFLKKQGGKIVQTMECVDASFFETRGHSCDFLISYGYRHIISQEVLSKFPCRAINLHISLLPWNRGADPNFWSFVENTPKGVTIHLLGEGIDTGDIIAQREVHPVPDDTLRSSYARLTQAIENLFFEQWPRISASNYRAKKQQGSGSFHRRRDREKLAHLLTEGWDTPVSVLEEYAKRYGSSIAQPP